MSQLAAKRNGIIEDVDQLNHNGRDRGDNMAKRNKNKKGRMDYKNFCDRIVPDRGFQVPNQLYLKKKEQIMKKRNPTKNKPLSPEE